MSGKKIASRSVASRPVGNEQVTSGQVVVNLQQQLRLAGVQVPTPAALAVDQDSPPTISTGCQALDAWFPQGGMTRGNTIEIVSPTLGAGATHFAMALAKQICDQQGLLVLIDRRQDFNPALLTALGFDLQNVLFVHPQTEEDHLWALEQALADTCVAAVWTRIEKLDKRYQRRWQLAAERGQSIGLLQRPEKVLGHPTWALAQIQVKSHPHSAWLVGNQRAGVGRQENWILELIAQRGKGRFDQQVCNIELHNINYVEWLNDLESQTTSKAEPFNKLASNTQPPLPAFFSQRLPHPNDPWFTKTSGALRTEASTSSAAGTQATVSQATVAQATVAQATVSQATVASVSNDHSVGRLSSGITETQQLRVQGQP